MREFMNGWESPLLKIDDGFRFTESGNSSMTARMDLCHSSSLVDSSFAYPVPYVF
jgi:hypothetical protein